MGNARHTVWRGVESTLYQISPTVRLCPRIRVLSFSEVYRQRARQHRHRRGIEQRQMLTSVPPQTLTPSRKTVGPVAGSYRSQPPPLWPAVLLSSAGEDYGRTLGARSHRGPKLHAQTGTTRAHP